MNTQQLLGALPTLRLESKGLYLFVLTSCFFYLLTGVNGFSQANDWTAVPKSNILSSPQLPLSSSSRSTNTGDRHPYHRTSEAYQSPALSSLWRNLPLSSPGSSFKASFPVARPRSLDSPSRKPRQVITQKSKKKSKTKKAATNTTTVAPAALSVADNENVGSSRTLLLAPFLAYIAPLFIAQMFGMGMIPAAALILFPIFLVPIALAMAVFLI